LVIRYRLVVFEKALFELIINIVNLFEVIVRQGLGGKSDDT
jgi:hypothetical protein